jgi:hypothetical protein
VANVTRPPASAAILMLALELLAVGLFTLLAGASPEAGTIMVIVMVTFWFIFAITDSAVIGHLGSVLGTMTKNPSNSGAGNALPV